MTDRKARRSSRRKAKAVEQAEQVPQVVDEAPVEGAVVGWVPAFPGQRPPFLPGNTLGAQPGNELNLRHGAYSPRRVHPLATELAEHARATTPNLSAPQWSAAVWAWARAEAQAQLLSEYLGDEVGDLADEKVRAAYLLLHRAEARADRGRARLGLDPLSAARLGRDTAAASVDVARLMQELEERDRRGAASGEAESS